jgi:hypothetical protein
MRKLLALILFVFLLIGCDGSNVVPGGDTPVDPEPVPPVVHLFTSHSEGIQTDSLGGVYAMAIISNNSDVAVESLRCSISLLDDSDNTIKTVNTTVPRIEPEEEAIISVLAGILDNNPELADAVDLSISFGTYKTDTDVYTISDISIKDVVYTSFGNTTTITGTIKSTVDLQSYTIHVAGLDNNETYKTYALDYNGAGLSSGVEQPFEILIKTADHYQFYTVGTIAQ